MFQRQLSARYFAPFFRCFSQILLICFAFCLIFVIFAVGFDINLRVKKVKAEVSFAGGTGASGDPYLIETPEQLNEMRYNSAAHYKLMADIDLSGYLDGAAYGFAPICNSNLDPFQGEFDGNGKTISGMFIKSSAKYVGFFGYLSGKIANFKLILNNEAGGISSSHAQTGAAAGYLRNGTVENVTVYGKVTGTMESTGGLIGNAEVTGAASNAGVRKSAFVGSVKGGQKTGGLIGSVSKCNVADCYVQAEVESGQKSGGFIGSIADGARVSASYFAGKFTGVGQSLGLFAGEAASGLTFSNCYVYSDPQSNVSALTGSGSYSQSGSIQKLTETQMKLKDSFVNYDFSSIWTIDEDSYPYFITAKNTGGDEEDGPPVDKTGLYLLLIEAGSFYNAAEGIYT